MSSEVLGLCRPNEYSHVRKQSNKFNIRNKQCLVLSFLANLSPQNNHEAIYRGIWVWIIDKPCPSSVSWEGFLSCQRDTTQGKIPFWSLAQNRGWSHTRPLTLQKPQEKTRASVLVFCWIHTKGFVGQTQLTLLHLDIDFPSVITSLKHVSFWGVESLKQNIAQS